MSKEAALAYQRAGYSVMPIVPRGKRPLLDSWLEYQRRLPTEAEIEQWWDIWPTANVAIITGKLTGKLVVDIDPKHGGKPDQILAQAPTELVTKTGSGGLHLWYAYPEDGDLYNRTGVFPGVDVRGEGGYVVVPPSIHETGAAYVWAKTGSPGSVNSTLRPLLEAPAQRNGVSPDDGWISELLAGASEGARNDGAARLSGYFAGKGLPPDVTLGLLRSWNDKNSPPLPDSELVQTLESVYRTAGRRGKPATLDVVAPPAEFRLLPFHEYMVLYGDKEIAWTVPDWLPEQTCGLVVAPPGHFKTWFLLDLAISVAGGFPFLGRYPVSNPGPVIVMQQEDFHGQLADRMGTVYASKLGDALGKESETGYQALLPGPIPLYLYPDRRFRFNDGVIVELLHSRIRELRPRLVILDPLYSAASTENYMAQAAEQMMVLKRLRDAYGTSFLVAHHTGKGSRNQETDREQAWGSQFLNAWLETGWQIRGIEGEAGVVSMHRHFKLKEDPADIRVTFRIKTDSPPYGYEASIGAVAKLTEQAVLDALGEDRIGLDELAQRTGASNNAVRRLVAQLKRQGLITEKGGKYHVVELPSFD